MLFCEQEVNKQLIFLSALIRPTTEEEDGGLLSNNNSIFFLFFRNTENEPTTPSPPARLQQAEYVLLLIHFVTKNFLTMHKILWLSGLDQTSNFS